MKQSSNTLKKAIIFLIVAISTLNGYAQLGNNRISTTNQNQVLPVTLLSFTSKAEDLNQIVLKWKTASEINNSHFDVLISTDGKSFVKYATIEGRGNSNEITDYEIVIDLKSKIITGSLFLSFLLISSVSNKKLRMGILVLFVLAIISCSKNGEKLTEEKDFPVKEEELIEEKNYYIKLIQTDNDGKTTELGIVMSRAKITK